MEYLQVLILAVIQGLAELLPVSSSAHVILAQKLMGLDPSDSRQVFLLVMLHTGTMFAVIVYFWPRWRALVWPVSRGSTSSGRFQFVWMVLLASAVTAVLSLGMLEVIKRVSGQEVEDLFRNLPLIGSALVAVGLLILVASMFEIGAIQPVVSTGSALFIGVVQALVLPFRGFSRSGATISAGFLCGMSRRISEDFSFALAVVITPAVIGRSLWKLLKDERFRDAQSVVPLLAPGLVGMLFAFLAGLVALRFLSAVLEKGGWKYFGFYCLGFAAVVFTVWATGK